MNEDLKPCYDIPSEWEPLQEIMPIYIFKHKRCDSLFRIIDFGLKEVTFKDTKIVQPTGVIDINRKLTDNERKEIMPIIIDVMHSLKSITMPYIHTSYKIYIELIGRDAIGLLYFMDNDVEKSIVPIKRFFRIIRDPLISFQEITFDYFREIKETNEEEMSTISATSYGEILRKENENVDQNTEQTADSELQSDC